MFQWEWGKGKRAIVCGWVLTKSPFRTRENKVGVPGGTLSYIQTMLNKGYNIQNDSAHAASTHTSLQPICRCPKDGTRTY